MQNEEQTTTPVSLGMVCCRVYTSTILDSFTKLNIPSELKSTVPFGESPFCINCTIIGSSLEHSGMKEANV